METTKIMDRILTEAKDKNVQEVRFVKDVIPGKSVRQGDIYLMMVPADFPCGKKTLNSQLVPGHSKGSRHCAAEGIEVFEGVRAPESWRKIMKKHWPNLSVSILEKELMGPRLRTNARALITHPEHAHVSLPAGCDVQVMYQLNPRTFKRAQD